MTDDVTQSWLGVRIEGNQKPDHYALLGADRFSRDLGLLKKLVYHQFSRVKAYEDHPDQAYRLKAHELMNAVSSAGADLSDPRRKAIYDRMLGARLVQRGQSHYVLTVAGGPAHLGQRMTVSPAAKPGGVLRWGKRDTERADLHFEKRQALLRIDLHGDTPVRVNGQAGRPPLIGHGDVVEVGGFRFRCEVVPDPKATAPAHGIRLRLQEARAVRHSWISLLDGETAVIGASDEALWQLEDGQVRQRHCELRFEQGQWIVRNLDSAASTQINGASVEHSVLGNRDRLMVGTFAIGIEIGDVG